MQRILILFLLLFSFQQKNCAEANRFDSLVISGINQIYNIKFEEAELTFQIVEAEYPDNPAGKFFDAMILWWTILLDLSNEEYDDMFLDKLEDVIDFCDIILEENPSNVDAVFFKGGALGFRARLYGIRKSWFNSALDGKEALPLVYRAYEIDSTNADVKLGFGIYNYYAAVIPENFPMVKPFMVFFPEGNKQLGLDQLEYVAEHGMYARIESIYFLATLNIQFEKNYIKATEYIEYLSNRFPDNSRFQRMLGRIWYKRSQLKIASSVFKRVLKKCDLAMPGYNDNARRESSYYVAMYYRKNGILDSTKYYLEMCKKMSGKIDEDKESGFLINSVLYLGNIYDLLGKREDAILQYEDVLNMRDYRNSHELAERYLEKPYSKN